MSPALVSSRALRAIFPRVSGDEPLLHCYVTVAIRFSPRERG